MFTIPSLHLLGTASIPSNLEHNPWPCRAALSAQTSTNRPHACPEAALSRCGWMLAFGSPLKLCSASITSSRVGSVISLPLLAPARLLSANILCNCQQGYIVPVVLERPQCLAAQGLLLCEPLLLHHAKHEAPYAGSKAAIGLALNYVRTQGGHRGAYQAGDNGFAVKADFVSDNSGCRAPCVSKSHALSSFQMGHILPRGSSEAVQFTCSIPSCNAPAAAEVSRVGTFSGQLLMQRALNGVTCAVAQPAKAPCRLSGRNTSPSGQAHVPAFIHACLNAPYTVAKPSTHTRAHTTSA